MTRSAAVAISLMLILLAHTFVVRAQQSGYTPALVSLVEAERAFARTSVERGIRESFLAFFADDGINFQPHPTKTREAYLKRPAPPPQRPPVTLNWHPIFADVSRAGDLGYTTGPYRLTDQSPERKPTQHGYYFSLWKRQPDGAWKVALDVGIETPAPDAKERALHFQAARAVVSAKPGAGANANLEQERAVLLKTDRDFISEANLRGAAKAFEAHLGDEARLHRNGSFPLTNRNAIRSFLSGKHLMLLSGLPLKADVAQSNDLGYTYGSYELKASGGAAVGASSASSEKGYYVRVWKRDRAGRWKIALDTTHPLPPAQK